MLNPKWSGGLCGLILTIVTVVEMSPASAAVAVRLPLPELVTESTMIVRGRVESSSSFMDQQRGRIYTKHTITVNEYWRGAGASVVEVFTLGGELEEIGQLVPGEARLEKDEHVLLCLQPSLEQPGYSIVGMAQGKFRVQEYAGRLALVRDVAGIAFVGEGGVEPGTLTFGSADQPQAGPGTEAVDYDYFRNMVTAINKSGAVK